MMMSEITLYFLLWVPNFTDNCIHFLQELLHLHPNQYSSTIIICIINCFYICTFRYILAVEIKSQNVIFQLLFFVGYTRN